MGKHPLLWLTVRSRRVRGMPTAMEISIGNTVGRRRLVGSSVEETRFVAAASKNQIANGLQVSRDINPDAVARNNEEDGKFCGIYVKRFKNAGANHLIAYIRIIIKLIK